MSTNKKYYWLKLPKDFFRRHDIRIIESMDGGRETLLIYLKLMTESIPHDGRLRFSEEIPYTPEMLATVLGDDKDMVVKAMDLLKKFHLLRHESDRTIVLPEVPKMMGCETAAASRMRKHRSSQSDSDVAQSKKKKKEQDEDEEQQQDVDDEMRAKSKGLTAVDINRLTTLFGDFTPYTKREYLKLKALYDDEVLHSAMEKAWQMGARTIGYVKKILEEVRT